MLDIPVLYPDSASGSAVSTSFLMLEDGTSFFLLEDGTSQILLEH